jgi:hypothetical protein
MGRSKGFFFSWQSAAYDSFEPRHPRCPGRARGRKWPFFTLGFTEKGTSTRSCAQPDKIPRQTPAGSSQYSTFYAVLSQSSYLQLAPSVDLSGISKIPFLTDFGQQRGFKAWAKNRAKRFARYAVLCYKPWNYLGEFRAMGL